METARLVLQWVQLAVFLGAAGAALRAWWRQRTRPAAFLAIAFATIGVTLLMARLPPLDEGGTLDALLGELVLIGLAAFPWLLALFAWSFEGRLPRWLLAAGVVVAGLGVWAIVLPPLPAPGERSGPANTFVLVFIGVWTVLALTAAGRLWQAGKNQPLARARMRLMAAGSLVLAAALLLAGSMQQDSPLYLATSGLAIISAVLFTAGFAPPRALRVWWRRRVTSRWQQMQLDLIAATTPRQAAEAVVPILSEALGGGSAVVSSDGQLLAHAGMDDQDAHLVADRIKTGDPPGPDQEQIAVEDHCLVIRKTAYTPLFGQDERDLVEGFALQLRLALQRAALFEDNERIRRELERAHGELQTMIVGLAHDLRSPAVTVGGFASLARATSDPAQRDEMLASIETSAAYLNELVDSLVELSRVGAIEIKREPVELSRTLEAVRQRLATVRPQVTVAADELPTVLADRLSMEQVFDNLVNNAARHGGRDDLTIRITYERGVADHLIMVGDDGAGIDPADRDTIFAPFQRGRNAAPGGSGVGLGLVRRILENHDGSIEVLDNAPGAHFLLRLPIR